MLTDSVTDRWFRVRVNEEFKDGEECTVTLKDRFKEQDEDEKLWYDRAFGPLRNIMKIKLLFRPPVEKVKPNMWHFFAKVNYTMFPEMGEEFDVNHYPTSDLYLLEVDNEDPELPEYYLELDRPYGTYSVQIFFREIEN